MSHWKGTLVALVTPFRQGAIDWTALDRLVDLQLEEGTDGLVLCGTTAESPTLTDDEQPQLIERVVRRVNHRCPIIVGSGSNSTNKSLKLSEQARDLGADGLMLVSPYYNKPTQQGLYEHFGYVASRVKLPIILYNIPGRCGVAIAPETIARLHHDFSNITTLKHATGGVEDAATLHSTCPINILSGDDPITLPLMAVGATGVISVMANLVPGRVRALTSAFLAGQFNEARRHHEELLPLARALFLETNPLPIKTALALRGLIAEEFRLPMCPMQPHLREKLVQVLREYQLVK
ncbi:MAG: 4-hydroxy-tetrahydrodipicolinate synthase [Phycisphaerae bacterium]|nr:4-hydroxy-tetrahydrodipicolinate synthase [Phycisphaerae bacterium]